MALRSGPGYFPLKGDRQVLPQRSTNALPVGTKSILPEGHPILPDYRFHKLPAEIRQVIEEIVLDSDDEDFEVAEIDDNVILSSQAEDAKDKEDVGPDIRMEKVKARLVELKSSLPEVKTPELQEMRRTALRLVGRLGQLAIANKNKDDPKMDLIAIEEMAKYDPSRRLRVGHAKVLTKPQWSARNQEIFMFVDEKKHPIVLNKQGTETMIYMEAALSGKASQLTDREALQEALQAARQQAKQEHQERQERVEEEEGNKKKKKK